MVMFPRIRDVPAGLLLAGAAAVLSGSAVLSGGTAPAGERSDSLSKSAETITGTIAMIRPDERVIVLVRSGPREPSATQLSWTESRSPETSGVQKSPITATEVAGETDYAFKVTPSTLIEVDGRRTSLDRLAFSRNKTATVRFVAKRTGDFAVEIKVEP